MIKYVTGRMNVRVLMAGSIPVPVLLMVAAKSGILELFFGPQKTRSTIPNEDINECDQFAKNENSPCDPLADCVNKPGNFTCECRDGYQGEVNVKFFVNTASL